MMPVPCVMYSWRWASRAVNLAQVQSEQRFRQASLLPAGGAVVWQPALAKDKSSTAVNPFQARFVRKRAFIGADPDTRRAAGRLLHYG